MTEPITTAEVNGRYWGAAAEDWAAIQEQLVRPVYEEALARLAVGRGTRYLDAGCGAGLAAQLAFECGAQVSGIDASENLLAIARPRVPKGDFRRAPIEQMPFADHTFDTVTGFNSFQFAADTVAALTEARRVTTTGGYVLIVTWGNPQGMPAAAIIRALKPLMPPPSHGIPLPGPFALSDEETLRSVVTQAGLDPVNVLDVHAPWHYESLDVALRGLRSSGVSARVIEHSNVEAVDAAHRAALEPFRQPDGSYRIGASFRCLIARA